MLYEVITKGGRHPGRTGACGALLPYPVRPGSPPLRADGAGARTRTLVRAAGIPEKLCPSAAAMERHRPLRGDEPTIPRNNFV